MLWIAALPLASQIATAQGLPVRTSPVQGSANPSSPSMVTKPTSTEIAAPRIAAPQSSPLESVRYAAARLLDHIPSTFEGDKHWGETKRVFNGVEMKFRDGRLRTHRRWKEVNHGRWINYKINLPDDGLRLNQTVHIDRAIAAVPPLYGYEMAMRIETPIKFEVRIQRHVRGVKLSSVTVEGRAGVQLHATVLVDTFSDITEIPPAVVIDPKILTAELKLERFEVDRISHVGGDVAEAWGEIAQVTLVENAIERQNEKLVDRLNTAIDKNRGDLRFSTRDFIRRVIPTEPVATQPN